MKQDLQADVDDSCHKNLGQPRETTICDCQQIIRTMQSLRSVDVFVRKIQEALDMNATISNRTVRRALREHGYG